jgi:hypothetical protein
MVFPGSGLHAALGAAAILESAAVGDLVAVAMAVAGDPASAFYQANVFANYFLVDAS